MTWVIRNSAGNYYTGKRVEQQTRFQGAMIFSGQRADAAELSDDELNAIVRDPKCQAGLVAEPFL